MQRMIFVNVPSSDLAASRAFYTGLGFAINEAFSNESAHYVVIEDNIAIIVQAAERFAEFVEGEIADAQKTTEVLIALSAGDRAECDDLKTRALASGGTEWKPAQDHGFMYGTSFADPDGHVLEVVWMDPAAVESGAPDMA